MPSELSDLVERLSALLRSEQRRLAAEHGLPAVQLQALHYLAACNRYSDTPLALAEFVDATRGTISQTLTALEHKGLIKKVADISDGRVVHCRLTPQGRRIAEQTWPPIDLEGLAGVAGQRLTHDLRELLRAVQRERGNRSFGVCRTCKHYRAAEGAGRCGLTNEPLSAADSSQICREHELAGGST